MSETTDERTVSYFLRTLRAVRSFRPDNIPQEVVDDVLEARRSRGGQARKPLGEIMHEERYG